MLILRSSRRRGMHGLAKRWHNAYGHVSYDRPRTMRPTKQKPRKSSDLRGFATITGGDGGCAGQRAKPSRV